MVQFVKHLLRVPLRFHGLADRTWIKRLPLILGNPIICPSCTYDKEALGEPLFDSPYKFALDWDTMWKLAERPGRFICEEKPLISYRIHSGATTKECIENHRRGHVPENLAGAGCSGDYVVLQESLQGVPVTGVKQEERN